MELQPIPPTLSAIDLLAKQVQDLQAENGRLIAQLFEAQAQKSHVTFVATSRVAAGDAVFAVPAIAADLKAETLKGLREILTLLPRENAGDIQIVGKLVTIIEKLAKS